ncbi:MAG: hypothetical protein K1X79_09580, partial [Oligoflexia bacterium]|nr:hypothetical protein [Oligoflexia bacterium]
MFNSMLEKAKAQYVKLGQAVGAALNAPSGRQIQVMLFVLGVCLLSAGLADSASAAGLTTRFNDTRLANSVNAILTYLEGTFGALVMVCAGVGAILSSAFGQYKAALGLMVVAVGAFILR